jgi:hypothetical protein
MRKTSEVRALPGSKEMSKPVFQNIFLIRQLLVTSFLVVPKRQQLTLKVFLLSLTMTVVKEKNFTERFSIKFLFQ